MPNRIEPLKNINDIRQIRECLTDRPRDLLLFDIVVSVSAPVKHLLQLKVKDLLGLEINDVFHVPRSRFQTVTSVFHHGSDL